MQFESAPVATDSINLFYSIEPLSLSPLPDNFIVCEWVSGCILITIERPPV